MVPVAPQTVVRSRASHGLLLPLLLTLPTVDAAAALALSKSSGTSLSVGRVGDIPSSTSAEAPTVRGKDHGSSRRPIRIGYAGPPDKFHDGYRPALRRAFDDAGLNVELADLNEPTLSREEDREGYEAALSGCDYLIYSPKGDLCSFAPFFSSPAWSPPGGNADAGADDTNNNTKLKAVLSLRAGVEELLADDTLPASVPVCRMVDPGLREGMVEYVTFHVLRYHLLGTGADDHLPPTRDGRQRTVPTPLWRPKTPPLARDRTVGILGLGALGGPCAAALAGGALNFNVLGWTRRPRHADLPGDGASMKNVECLHGDGGLRRVLSESDILVLLLPRTAQTENVINRETLSMCKEGVAIINPGRGHLIDDEALLDALDRGVVSGATLDVFRTEPLPDEHPYWSHPRVVVTPHVAAKTRVETASEVVAENVRRAECGERMLYVVDRDAGY